MAASGMVIRTCGSIIVIFLAIVCHAKHIPPSIASYSITELNNGDGSGRDSFAGKIYALQLRGVGFFGSDDKNMQWILTNSPDRYGAPCDERDLILGSVKLIESSDDKCILEVFVPNDKINHLLYFCLKTSDTWIHQGEKLVITPAKDTNLYLSLNEYTDNTEADQPMDVEGQIVQDSAFSSEYLFPSVYKNQKTPENIYPFNNANKNDNFESNEVFTHTRGLNEGLEDINNHFVNVMKQAKPDNFNGKNEINEDPENVQKYLSDNSVKDNLHDLLQNEDDQFVVASEEALLNNEAYTVSTDLKDSIEHRKINEDDSGNREPLKEDTGVDFYGDVDQATGKSTWIDLSHDIDVNYDEGVQHGSDISDDTVATYRNKYLADGDDDDKSTQSDDSGAGFEEVDRDIVVVKKSDNPVKMSEKMVENTWDGFKEAAASPRTVPKHWIDLSHDIDVNYPSVDSGIVLDVEGVDVDKNIYDKNENHEDIETVNDGVLNKKVSEVDDMGFGSNFKTETKSEVKDESESGTREELSESKSKEALKKDTELIKKDSNKTIIDNKIPEKNSVLNNTDAVTKIIGSTSLTDTESKDKSEISRKGDIVETATTKSSNDDISNPGTVSNLLNLPVIPNKINDDLVVQLDDYDFVTFDLSTHISETATEQSNIQNDGSSERQPYANGADKFVEGYSNRKLLSIADDTQHENFNDLNSVYEINDPPDLNSLDPDDPNFMTSDFFKTNIRDKREIPSESGKEYVSKDEYEFKPDKEEVKDSTVSDYLDKISNEGESKSETILPAGANSVLGFGPLRIESIRVEEANRDVFTEAEGVPELLADTETVIRLFGTGIGEDTLIIFTHDLSNFGGQCQFPATGYFEIEKGSVSERSARARITLPPGAASSKTFYICAKRAPKSDRETSNPYTHQGSEPWLRLRTYAKLLPLWASLCIVAICLLFSALFSGLNLGLMSLDRTELKILCNTGTESERKHARTIQPVRDHGNYLLCSILLGNVAVNSTFTILLDDLTSGLFAVIFSTLSIVLLGEITPQAICSRHGLAVGARTIHVTKAVMAITFPLSYPVSKLLDFLLGEEIGNVYNRERLKELVKVTTDINDLDRDEVNIISGALELRKKIVSEIMTKIEDVFMLDYDAVLDFETVSEIMKSGYSRIPVYEGNRTNIIAMLYIKDLAFVDPDDNTPLRTLCQFYQNPCYFVFEDVTLDVIFKQFKEGHKGHMAFVQRVNNEGEGDPFYETVGLVTLEDVIEELIQAEIVDETDVFTDNKSKRRRMRPPKLQDFGAFAERRETQRIRISPQLTLATFQYLSTAVDAFKPDVVSETILRRMLKQDIIHHIKFRSKERQKTDPTTLIYEQGKPVDYFVLILEGRVEVTVGKENLVFESGPFTYFGSQALMQFVCIAESPVVPPTTLGSLQSINMDEMIRYSFVPDYSVRAITEVFYVTIKRSLYLAAKRATLMEKCAGSGRHKSSDDAGEQFDDEVEKLLHSLEEEGSPVPTRSPSHNMNSHHVSPVGLNGSVHASRQHSPSKTITQEIPSQGVDAHNEDSALLPRS